MTTAIEYIPTESLHPDETQPRKTFSADSLESLAKSIRKDGVIAPLTVTPDGENYQIVMGERRWRASKLAGMETVPCIVRNDLTQADIRRLQFAENDLREAVCPLERAEAFKTALDSGLTQDALAAELIVSRDTIAATLRLLELAPDARIALARDGLPETAARETLRLRVFDRLCGEGVMGQVCHLLLRNRTRARTYREVRHHVDHWLAQLWIGLLWQGAEAPRELPENANLDAVDAWCARYVRDDDRRGSVAADFRAELTVADGSFSYFVAWILVLLKPDFSRLTDADREAIERAYRRVAAKGEQSELDSIETEGGGDHDA